MITLFDEEAPEKPWLKNVKDDYGNYRNIVIRVRTKEDFEKLNKLMDGILSRKPAKVNGFNAYRFPEPTGPDTLDAFTD